MNTILQGDALTRLRELPDNYVQTVVTSPPYFSLRDYGVPGQIGLEATPEEFIDRLVEVFREVKRVLRHDGTLWVNMGDSYANDDKWGGSTGGKHIEELHGDNAMRRRRYTGLAPKNLLGMPWRLAFALQSDGWILRSEIIWHKPTPMPESVTDRPTKAHEQIFLLAKNERYFYDADAIREPLRPKTFTTFGTTRISKGNDPLGKVKSANYADQVRKPRLDPDGNPAGANKRTVWTVAHYNFAESHFATFPPKLIEPCILAGSRPGDIVLDPFMGAGTTALAALWHGRQYLGIELNPAYIALAEKRIAYVQQNLWDVAWMESEVPA